MPLYSYGLAKEKLSDVEKERIVAIFLSREDVFGNTDWNRATKAFGSASIDSMKKSLSNSLKKIIVTNDDEADPTTTGDQTPKAPKTPKTPASTGKGNRKRLFDFAALGEDGDMPTPTPKKRGRPAKSKVKVEETATEDDNGGHMMVNDVSAAGEQAYVVCSTITSHH